MPCVGGLTGANIGGTITDCYATADIEGAAEKAVGGLVGKNTGTLTSSYSTGKVVADNYAGGFVGANYGQANVCAAVNASLSGEGAFTGRFGGNNNSLNVSTENLAWNEMPHSGSWSDFADHSLRDGLSPKAQSTYKDALRWDFNNVWFWKEKFGAGYPELRIVKTDLPNALPLELIQDDLSVSVVAEDEEGIPEIYNLQGIFVGNRFDTLSPGFYIVRNVNKTYKIKL